MHTQNPSAKTGYWRFVCFLKSVWRAPYTGLEMCFNVVVSKCTVRMLSGAKSMKSEFDRICEVRCVVHAKNPAYSHRECCVIVSGHDVRVWTGDLSVLACADM